MWNLNALAAEGAAEGAAGGLQGGGETGGIPPSTSWLIWAGLQDPLSLSFLLCKMGVMVTARQDH